MKRLKPLRLFDINTFTLMDERRLHHAFHIFNYASEKTPIGIILQCNNNLRHNNSNIGLYKKIPQALLLAGFLAE
ncbi:MAG: hypothetical protein K2N16_00835 [Muribaculaceae bacterium]|nr:hypothetical protein [Muribaculaceae bacterium]